MFSIMTSLTSDSNLEITCKLYHNQTVKKIILTLPSGWHLGDPLCLITAFEYSRTDKKHVCLVLQITVICHIKNLLTCFLPNFR